MYKTQQNKTTTSGQSGITFLKSGQSLKDNDHEKIDRKNFYHLGATREIMDIRKRKKTAPRQQDW